MVWISSAASRALAFGPMPFSLRAESGHTRVGMSASVTTVSPPGLSSSDAIFDRSLFGVTPMEHVSPVAVSTVRWMRRRDLLRARPRIRQVRRFVRENELGQIDVDLIDPAVFDVRRDRAHRLLEQTRVAPVFVEIGGKQQRVRSELRCFHERHAGAHAESTRFVGGGRNDAAALVSAQRRHSGTRRFGVDASAASADDQRLAAKLRIAQQLDRRIERIHVEVRDETSCLLHGSRPQYTHEPAFTSAGCRWAAPSRRPLCRKCWHTRCKQKQHSPVRDTSYGD